MKLVFIKGGLNRENYYEPDANIVTERGECLGGRQMVMVEDDRVRWQRP